MPCHVNFICVYFLVRCFMFFALLGSNGALWDRDNDTMSCYGDICDAGALHAF